MKKYFSFEVDGFFAAHPKFLPMFRGHDSVKLATDLGQLFPFDGKRYARIVTPACFVDKYFAENVPSSAGGGFRIHVIRNV